MELAAVAVGVEGARIAKSMSFKVGEEPIILSLIHICVLQHHALRQVEGEAGGLIPESKQAQFLAQLPVIPALGLLDALQIGVQFLLLGEGDAVDPLEGLPVGVAPPVGGVAGQQLDGVALYPAGGVQMGGETLAADEVFGTIEVVKTISDLFLPVNGEILEPVSYTHLFCVLRSGVRHTLYADRIGAAHRGGSDVYF